MEPSPDALRAGIDITILAHCSYPKEPSKAIRHWDHVTPYAVHPIWCAMTILAETTLPASLRSAGYQALLWHDIPEDTSLPLPHDVEDEVKQLVSGMTFASLRDEIAHVWERGDTIILLKLYDKVSNLLDGSWMSDEQWNAYVGYTESLCDRVRLTHGELNIVRIATAVCRRRG